MGVSLEQVLTALGGAGAAGVAVKLLDLWGGRRSAVTAADVALSAEARAWAERFGVAMEEQAKRHAADMAALAARVSGLEERLVARESRIRDLEVENTRLLGDVGRLTARVAELERGKPA